MDRLIAADEGPVFETREGGGSLLLVCEHAAKRLPRYLGTLGLSPADLERHIAWDPGALAVAAGVAKRLDGTLVAQRFSRLVVDCNRDPAAPDAIVTRAEGIAVPGNADLTDADRELRFSAVWQPFHDALTRVVDRRRQAARPTVLATIHTFTPTWHGVARPWHVGVISTDERSLADLVLDALSREPSLVVGDNQPYSAKDNVDYTIRRYGKDRGLPHVMIEIRNDLVASPEEQAAWADRLARVFRPLLATVAAA
jgi:predicted N-formylglutamate amidohydrolase